PPPPEPRGPPRPASITLPAEVSMTRPAPIAASAPTLAAEVVVATTSPAPRGLGQLHAQHPHAGGGPDDDHAVPGAEPGLHEGVVLGRQAHRQRRGVG